MGPSGGRTGKHHREGVPGPAVPDRRRHRADHEDAQDAESQPARVRGLQPAEIPSQGAVLILILLKLYQFFLSSLAGPQLNSASV